MTEPARHDNRLAYAETEEEPAPGAFTVTWAADGRAASLEGACPACGGRTGQTFTLLAGPGRMFGRPRPAELPEKVTLYCECGHVHPRRPPAARDHGCGRYWQVTVPGSDRRAPETTPGDGRRSPR